MFDLLLSANRRVRSVRRTPRGSAAKKRAMSAAPRDRSVPPASAACQDERPAAEPAHPCAVRTLMTPSAALIRTRGALCVRAPSARRPELPKAAPVSVTRPVVPSVTIVRGIPRVVQILAIPSAASRKETRCVRAASTVERARCAWAVSVFATRICPYALVQVSSDTRVTASARPAKQVTPATRVMPCAVTRSRSVYARRFSRAAPPARGTVPKPYHARAPTSAWVAWDQAPSVGRRERVASDSSASIRAAGNELA
jgi:hypothetical protein